MDITAQVLATLAPGQRVVPGRVELVTTTPIVLPRQESLGRRLAEFHGRQPWILPALVLGLVMAGMLGRRV